MKSRSTSKKQSRRRHLVEQLEVRNLLAADPFGTNPMQRFDVSHDGTVAALDALLIINALGRSGSNAADPRDNVGTFIDVTGDGQGTALDALQVINAIGRSGPLIAATLPNDSAPADRNDLALDLITNEYSMDLNVSVGSLADRSVELRVGAEGAFVDITDSFEDGKSVLSPADIDAVFGGPLPEGTHEITA